MRLALDRVNIPKLFGYGQESLAEGSMEKDGKFKKDPQNVWEFYSLRANGGYTLKILKDAFFDKTLSVEFGFVCTHYISHRAIHTDSM